MEFRKKHAFLIMAHNEWDILKKILIILDYPTNDIYIHIDKKVKQVDLESLKKEVKESNLYFVKRMKISWGGYSLVNCELVLLSAAIKAMYEYYHLISGVDMPLKTPQEIDAFFMKNKGRNFISIEVNISKTRKYLERINLYHFLQDNIGRNRGKMTSLLAGLENRLLKLQNKFGIDRTVKEQTMFYKGAQWFSINHAMAKQVLTDKKFIKKHFKYTHCADEIFLQTIAMRSELRETICSVGVRYIDWRRGNPYTFRLEDYDELINSEMLFARKFSSSVDEEVIDKLFENLMKRKNSDKCI